MRNIRNLTRRAVLVTVSVTATLVLAACGNNGDSGGDAGSGSSASSSASAGSAADAHNAQDTSFAQGMVPHHQQALAMARLAADRASSAQVKDLASRIEKAQDPEIETMSGWLTSWGEGVPTSSDSTEGSMPGMDHSSSSMPGMDHSSSSMPGMMDSSHMDELEKASGTHFDTMFLTMMIEHHKGAVDMATTEKDKGRYEPATSMADGIVTAQTAEIAEMNKLLGKG